MADVVVITSDLHSKDCVADVVITIVAWLAIGDMQRNYAKPVLIVLTLSGILNFFEQQRRNLPATPPRRLLNRLPSEQLMKETEEYASGPESPVSPAVTRSVELVRLNDESANDDSRFPDDDSLDQETSQSLVPHSSKYGSRFKYR